MIHQQKIFYTWYKLRKFQQILFKTFVILFLYHEAFIVRRCQTQDIVFIILALNPFGVTSERCPFLRLCATFQVRSGGKKLVTCVRFDRLEIWTPSFPIQKKVFYHLCYLVDQANNHQQLKLFEIISATHSNTHPVALRLSVHVGRLKLG